MNIFQKRNIFRNANTFQIREEIFENSIFKKKRNFIESVNKVLNSKKDFKREQISKIITFLKEERFCKLINKILNLRTNFENMNFFVCVNKF